MFRKATMVQDISRGQGPASSDQESACSLRAVMLFSQTLAGDKHIEYTQLICLVSE